MPTLSRSRGLLLYGGEFTPRSLPGLKLWLPPDRGNVFTGNSRQYVAASSQYHSIADNASLSTGDVAAWGSIWMRADTAPGAGAQYRIYGKYATTGNQRTWLIDWDKDTNRLRLIVSGDGIAANVLPSAKLGAVSTLTWYHLFWWHDPVANIIGFIVNGGTPDTAAHTTGLFDSTAPLTIGSQGNPGDYFDGRLAPAVFGKNVVGGFATTPAATIAATLYNGGAGVDLRGISAATRTAWGGVSAWPGNETGTGTMADVWQTLADNTLTANNSPSAAAGPYLYPAIGDDPIRQISELSGQGNHATAIPAAEALHKLAIINGKPVARYDGVNDVFSLTSALVLSGDFTYCAVVKVDVSLAASAYFGHSSGTGFISQTDTTTLTLSNDAATTLALTHAALDTGFHVLTLVRSGSTVSRYLDGTLDGSGTLAGTITLNQMGRHGAATAPLNGDVADDILYTQAVSGGSLSRLVRWAGQKYALAVAA